MKQFDEQHLKFSRRTEAIFATLIILLYAAIICVAVVMFIVHAPKVIVALLILASTWCIYRFIRRFDSRNQ